MSPYPSSLPLLTEAEKQELPGSTKSFHFLPCFLLAAEGLLKVGGLGDILCSPKGGAKIPFASEGLQFNQRNCAAIAGNGAQLGDCSRAHEA